MLFSWRVDSKHTVNIMKPLYLIQQNGESKLACAQCVDTQLHIVNCQPAGVRHWIRPTVSKVPVQMGECPSCAIRKASERAFDPEL